MPPAGRSHPVCSFLVPERQVGVGFAHQQWINLSAPKPGGIRSSGSPRGGACPGTLMTPAHPGRAAVSSCDGLPRCLSGLCVALWQRLCKVLFFGGGGTLCFPAGFCAENVTSAAQALLHSECESAARCPVGVEEGFRGVRDGGGTMTTHNPFCVNLKQDTNLFLVSRSEKGG